MAHGRFLTRITSMKARVLRNFKDIFKKNMATNIDSSFSRRNSFDAQLFTLYLHLNKNDD